VSRRRPSRRIRQSHIPTLRSGRHARPPELAERERLTGLAEKITAVDELVALIDADRIGKPVAMNNTNSVRVALVSIVTAWNPGWRPLPRVPARGSKVTAP
jgi:hypothetical protein